jgi:hypothetical protein
VLQDNQNDQKTNKKIVRYQQIGLPTKDLIHNKVIYKTEAIYSLSSPAIPGKICLSWSYCAKIHSFEVNSNKNNGLKTPALSLTSLEIKHKNKAEQIT